MHVLVPLAPSGHSLAAVPTPTEAGVCFATGFHVLVPNSEVPSLLPRTRLRTALGLPSIPLMAGTKKQHLVPLSNSGSKLSS